MPEVIQRSGLGSIPRERIQYLILDLAFKKEADLGGLIRFRLEALLPQGLEGYEHFFTRIGRSSSFLVTLVEAPLPPSFFAQKARLPFALEIPDKVPVLCQWRGPLGNEVVRYEGGLARELWFFTEAEQKELEALRLAQCGLEWRVREAANEGPMVQARLGGLGRLMPWLAAALFLFLLGQMALASWSAINAKTVRLGVLEQQLSLLAGSLGEEPDRRGEAVAKGLQLTAAKVQREIESRWRQDHFLTKWSFKERTLVLEGWGPDALGLLSSLRSSRTLRSLKPMTVKGGGGAEFFVFSGEVADD